MQEENGYKQGIQITNNQEEQVGSFFGSCFGTHLKFWDFEVDETDILPDWPVLILFDPNLFPEI